MQRAKSVSYTHLPELTISYPTNGFSINTNTYKRLDMSYCLVLQNNTLCAMPCIATIYRYRTKTFEMTAESLTRLNNQSGYGFNVTTTAGQVGSVSYTHLFTDSGIEFQKYYEGTQLSIYGCVY